MLAVAADLHTAEARRPPLPPVQDNALLWKERYTGGRSILLTPQLMLLGLTGAGLCIPTVLVVLNRRLSDRQPANLGDALQFLTGECSGGLQALYAFLLVCYCIGVALRAAGCLVRERQLHTLDMLLQLPIERREILRAKWLGAMLKGWPWLALIVADLVIGLLIGAYHPVSFLFMLVFPLPLIFALCSAGLLISTIADTTARANLATGCMLLAMVVCAGTTRPGLFVGYSAFTYTWWQSPHVERTDLIAAGMGALTLLCIAGSARGLAGLLFERLGRR